MQGIGVAADLVRGEQLLRAAAEAGWAPALGELERYCFARAEQLMSLAGADEAQRMEAVYFYRKAGELGHRRAAYRLAMCYHHGEGVAADATQAMSWYRKAARLFEAKVALADMYYFGYHEYSGQLVRMPGRPCAGMSRPLSSMRMLMPCTGWDIACCMLRAARWKMRHEQAGVRWLRKAAALGEAGAQYALGCAYADGHGRMHNARLAVKWLRRAAQQGHQAARTFLQEMGTH